MSNHSIRSVCVLGENRIRFSYWVKDNLRKRSSFDYHHNSRDGGTTLASIFLLYLTFLWLCEANRGQNCIWILSAYSLAVSVEDDNPTDLYRCCGHGMYTDLPRNFLTNHALPDTIWSSLLPSLGNNLSTCKSSRIVHVRTFSWWFWMSFLQSQVCRCISELCRQRSSYYNSMLSECNARADIPKPEVKVVLITCFLLLRVYKIECE